MATKKKTEEPVEKVEKKAKAFEPYYVKVAVTALNVRVEADFEAPVVRLASKGERLRIVGGDKQWGQIKDGWILLKFTVKD